jgi:hypothetical protein
MTYLVLDTYVDKNAADEKADAYKKAGRENVEIMSVNGITVNDCSCFPCEAKFVQDGSPLYVVISQG